MRIIYMAGIYTSNILKWGFENCKGFGQLPGSKFHKLILEGLRNRNDEKAFCISNVPFRPSQITNDLSFDESQENGVVYLYPSVFKKKIKNYVETLKYYKKALNRIADEKSIIICDVLNASMCRAALKYSRKKKTKCYGIVTDLASFLPSDGTFRQKIVKSYTMRNIRRFDGYIFLTEYMNKKINIYNKPYIVVECVVEHYDTLIAKKECNNRIVYAGGINREYGVPELIEGFISADLQGYELHLFGNGNCIDSYDFDYLKTKNVFLRGVVPNEIVVEEERKAILLVNPRPPHEEFTKYSFPSKNMEYMISGTPMIGYRLPGIPNEYFDKMFLFDGFGADSIADTFRKMFKNLKVTDFIKKGRYAQKFVFENKNKDIVGKMIYDRLLKK